MTNLKNLLKILFLSTLALNTTSTNQLLAQGAQEPTPLTELLDNNTTTRTTPVYVSPAQHQCSFCIDNNLFDNTSNLIEHFIAYHISYYSTCLLLVGEQKSTYSSHAFVCPCGEAFAFEEKHNEEIIPQKLIDHIKNEHAQNGGVTDFNTDHAI